MVSRDELIGITEYDAINQVPYKPKPSKPSLTVCILCYSNTICQRKNSACHILKFFRLCHYGLKPSYETMEYVKQYCYCGNICLPICVENFPHHKMCLLSLKNLSEKSSYVHRLEGKIEQRSSSAYPNYRACVPTCSIL